MSTLGESDGSEESKQLEKDFVKMQNEGIQVLKVDRRGKLRKLTLRLINGGRSITWKSKFFGSKFGSRNRVDDARILRISVGQSTPAFELLNKKDAVSKSRSVSIFYTASSGDRSLDLIIEDKDDFRCINSVFTALLNKFKKDKEMLTADELFLREMWLRADDNGDGSLNEQEIYQLMAAMNIQMNRSTVRKIFRDFDLDGNGQLDLDEFKQLLAMLQKRPAMEEIWGLIVTGSFQKSSFIRQGSARSPRDAGPSNAYAIKKSTSVQQYLTFWKEHQGESMTEEKLLEQLRANLKGVALSTANLRISYPMWLQIMTHPSNDLFDPAKATVHQNMTFPLTYYYIASSHNTYLEGDQLTSFSSVNRYVNDLLSGCRCVELDCWNGDNGEPIIYHGHTLTSKILFQDVVEAVKQNAFVNSPYPVILSIENHCDFAQQIRLAEIMKTILGDSLYIPPDVETLSAPGGMFPSPEQLKYKVLVKGKRAVKLEYTVTHDDEDIIGSKGQEKLGKTPSFLNRVIGRTQSSKKLTSGKIDEVKGSSTPGSASSSGRARNDETLASPISPISPMTKTSSLMRQESQKSMEEAHDEHDGEGGGSVAPELSDITTLCGSKVKIFGTYDDTMAAPWGICCSYSESKVVKYFKNPVDYTFWVFYNQKHFSRIYPSGTRIDSSNYDVGEAFAAGAQLIALNYQTHDTNMHFYRGKFRENGGCGYVLKPQFLISYPLRAPSPPVVLNLTIISAHQLPKAHGIGKPLRDIIDPYVQVQITGVTLDCAKWRTKTINDNGFNPTYNESKSFVVKNPDVALIAFDVYDDDMVSAEFIAYASMPVHCMRRGLRTCALYDTEGRRDGDFAFASLLVYVDIEPFVG